MRWRLTCRWASATASAMRRRAATWEQLKGFYVHALVYATVTVGLFLINWLTRGDGDDSWSFYWPLLGWGIGLGAHAISVFGRGALLGPKWEQQDPRLHGA